MEYGVFIDVFSLLKLSLFGTLQQNGRDVSAVNVHVRENPNKLLGYLGFLQSP